LLDGVYLVARQHEEGHTTTSVIDLMRHSDQLRSIFSILRKGNTEHIELRYVAGFFDGAKTHTVTHSVPCELAPRTFKTSSRPWEGALIPKDAPKPGMTIAQIRAHHALGRIKYTFPEQALQERINSDLCAPSPHLQISKFTPPQSKEVTRLSQWTREKPSVEWRASLYKAAQDVISEAQWRHDKLAPTPEGKRFLQCMGEDFCDSPYLPLKPSSSTNIWNDPFRDAAATAMATGYVNLSYLTHPDMLEGHLHATKQSFIPTRYKHIPVLSEAIRDNRGISYNEFGAWPKGYSEEDLMNESTISALPNLWAQSFKGVPTLAGIVGSSMNWMAGAQGYAAAALAGFPVFVAADGLQKSREIQAKLYERTVELIKNHPLVKNYPWPEHKLSNGERAVDYLVRTAISRVGITVKPFPTEEARASVAFFLDKYGIQNYRLYDPGITKLLITGSEAISQEIAKRTDLMAESSAELMRRGPLASDVGYVAGQVSNMAQAKMLARHPHLRGLIIGITEGGHCETGIKHGLYANNLPVLYQVARMGLPFPILADGGPGLEGLPNVFLCGGSGVLLSGALFGGVLEHAPFNNWFIDSNGQPMKFTFGEAALTTKGFGGEAFGSGTPKNKEGIASFKILNAVYPTLAHKALDAVFVAAKCGRFMRTENIEQLRLMPEPRVVHGSADADEARRPHNKEFPARTFGSK
jgi:hypothetical protein